MGGNINGKQIQHLYHLSKGGHAVYDRTETIDVFNVDFKTDIVHLIIVPEAEPEPLPTREEVIELLTPEIDDANEATFYGVLPEWFALI